MPQTDYDRIVAYAQSTFLDRLRACRTQKQAMDCAAEVAQKYASPIAGSAEYCVRILMDNHGLVLRRLPDSELADCETIADAVYTFIEHDLKRELQALVPSSLPEGGD